MSKLLLALLVATIAVILTGTLPIILGILQAVTNPLLQFASTLSTL